MKDYKRRAEDLFNPCVDKLADYAHEAWAGWMKYQEKVGSPKFWEVLPSILAQRWIRQANTDYADLPEDEKKSDRVEARRMLAIVMSFIIAALEQAYKDGVEELRDVIMSRYVYLQLQRDRIEEEAARLLSFAKEVKP